MPSYTYPPASWPQPHHQLQELEEELEEDGEGDGEEEEPAVIDEEWEGFEQSGSMPDPSFKGARMGPNTLPVAYMGPAGAKPADPREPPQGKGALGKILRIMSSSSSSKTKPDSTKPAIVVNVPKGVVLEESEHQRVLSIKCQYQKLIVLFCCLNRHFTLVQKNIFFFMKG